MSLSANKKAKHTHLHLKFVRRLMLGLGIWPLEATGFKLHLYNFYFYLSFCYYILYDISQAVQGVLSIRKNVVRAAANLGITIVYVINIYKVLIFRSKKFRALLKIIEEKEHDILNSHDDSIIGIYIRNSKTSNKSAVGYLTLGSIGMTLYYVTPIVNNIVFPLPFNNITGVQEKYLIFSSWFPFNEFEHYYAAYFIQTVAGWYGYAYIVHCGAFYIVLLSFVTGQLKILQHIFRNFSRYTQTYAVKSTSTVVSLQRLLTRELIEEHHDLIRFVDELNNAVKYFTLLDFAISSFQLSLVVFQIMFTVGANIERVAALSYFLTRSTQLYLEYSNGQEISSQSEQLPQSIFESEWYEYPENIKKMFHMVIMRAQKPLVLTIGPFGLVTVDALLQIYRALYSFVCIMQK